MTIPKMMKKSGEEITRLRVFVMMLCSLFVMMLCNFVELVLMVPMAMAVFVIGLNSFFYGCIEYFCDDGMKLY